MNMNKDMSKIRAAALSAVFLSATLAMPAFAQQDSQPAPAQQQAAPAAQNSAAAQGTPADTTQPAKQDATDKGTYATGQPLPQQSKEGFWGHVNPLARKKWVHRQIDPVKDRVNELDQLQAKNANDIKDVDSRATAGIKRANDAAAAADQHAQAAGTRADQANGLATTASTRTDALHGTVSNLDQYQTVSSTPVNFLAGHTTLTKKAKADLDQVATTLGSEKGYILEVQGYSRSGVASSQAMADAVVRYLVTEHQVPVYRIYKSGLGKVKMTASADGDKPLTNGVRVKLLHNSLANMSGQPGTPQASTQPSTPSSGPRSTGADSANTN